MNPPEQQPSEPSNDSTPDNNQPPQQPETQNFSPTPPQPATSAPSTITPQTVSTEPTLPAIPQEEHTVQPTAPQGVFVGGPAPVPQPQQPRKRKKKLFIISGVAILLLATTGFVFGYYLPNQPENVYKTGLSRTGKALSSIIDGATEQDKLSKVEKSELSGKLTATYRDQTVNGNFSVKLDKTTSNGHFEYGYKFSDGEQKILADFMTRLDEKSTYPDVYFRISGLQEITDLFMPSLSAYNNRWIAVESAYLENLTKDFAVDEPKNRENVSADEIASLIKSVNDVTNEYVFTSDSSKAVIEKKSYVKKEKTSEGVTAFRYKVGFNAQHLVAYCKAVVNKTATEPAFKKLLNINDKEVEELKDDGLKGCDDVGKDTDPDYTFDMWIDSKYKLIHKLRFTDKDKSDPYFEVGQIYKGGDKVSLFVNSVSEKDKADMKLTVDLDLKNMTSTGKFTANLDISGPIKIDGELSAQPYEGEIKVEKPADAAPIDEVIKAFGFDPTGMSGIYKAPAPGPSTITL